MKLTFEEMEEKVDRDKHSLDLSLSLLKPRHIASNDIPLVCRYLKANPDITTLDLRNNNIGDEGARTIATNTTISTLIVGGCGIKTEGVKALVANKTITILDIGFNNIRDEGAKLMAGLLIVNTKLTTLALVMSNIGDEGAKAIATNTTLTKLNLNCNNIGDEGAKALAANTTLTTLYISSNNIRGAGAIELAANKKIKILDIRYNKIEEEDTKELVSALKNNFILINFLYHCKDQSMSETINNILSRNIVLPWYHTIWHARLMAQAKRTDNCMLGKLPVELLGLINNYAVSSNHFSFFMKQFDKRPTEEDLTTAKGMVFS